jgi:Fe2+ transport system protein B
MQVNLFLVGNLNFGKITIFNKLIGLDQSVGNWPGKMVAAYMSLRSIFSPLVAYSLMVFILLYTPCAATVGVIL